MSAPKPEPISHRRNGHRHRGRRGCGLGADNLLLGCVVGIAVGIVLSIAKTLYVDRKRRRR